MDNLKFLIRKRDRYIRMISELNVTHKGNELNFTYWGGFKMGELRGKLSLIEDILDTMYPDWELEHTVLKTKKD